jgi:hypothetical protein
MIVTKNFSGTRLQKKSNGWTAREVWLVTGTADKDAAIEAAVAHAAPHADNTNMTVFARDADPVGALAWRVNADYAFGDPGLCADSPLDENPTILYDHGRETIPTEIDIDNNHIVNSAGDPFDPPETATVPIVGMIVRRAEPFFSLSRSLAYSDHVNSDAFSITGAGGVDPGQAYCDYIKPREPYTLAAPFVWMEYRFEFAGGTDPFQNHPVDQGQYGFYTDGDGDPQKGPLCWANGSPVGIDIRLDGTGMPIDTRVKVLGADQSVNDPIANPDTPPGLTVDPDYSSNDNLKLLIWKTKPTAVFSTLL